MMLLFAVAPVESALQTLSVAGTLLLVACVGFVLALCCFCFFRILREPAPSDHHHTPLDIDTHDWDA